jgi:hypothetical protein
MPAARSPADILVLALYALTGGRAHHGRMLQSIAGHLEITADQVLEMARAAEKAGLVQLRATHSVALTGEGQERGTTLTLPANRWARASRRPA